MRAGKNPISVDIQLDLDSSIGKVSLITEDFSRVILNLCNNAFDALRERQAASSEQKEKKFDAKLVIKTELDGGSVRLFIEDNGPGIPSDIIDKILQPFFTTKKGTEGTGLGLSITNDIIKAHGGQLDVESEVGTMTRFIITLPKQ
jgi:signal transduction histidine kinase